jgi:hypothetical protein
VGVAVGDDDRLIGVLQRRHREPAVPIGELVESAGLGVAAEEAAVNLANSVTDEGEFVVVIGKPVKNASPEEARALSAFVPIRSPRGLQVSSGSGRSGCRRYSSGRYRSRSLAS